MHLVLKNISHTSFQIVALNSPETRLDGLSEIFWRRTSPTRRSTSPRHHHHHHGGRHGGGGHCGHGHQNQPFPPPLIAPIDMEVTFGRDTVHLHHRPIIHHQGDIRMVAIGRDILLRHLRLLLHTIPHHLDLQQEGVRIAVAQEAVHLKVDFLVPKDLTTKPQTTISMAAPNLQFPVAKFLLMKYLEKINTKSLIFRQQ